MQIKGELATLIYEGFDYGDGEEVKTITVGEWVDDGKYSFRESIVTYQDKFYAIQESRSGSYFTDYHYEDPEIYEVTKRVEMVETTFWDIVK